MATEPRHQHLTVSRRQFLGVGATAAAGLALPPPAWVPGAAAYGTTGFAGSLPLRLAMHVHGSWSEGLASWEAQFTQAAATGVDVLYLTDHDNRATALGYLPSVAGITWVRSTTGTLARQAMTASGEAIQVLAESASSTAPASVTMQIEPNPTAFNKLRTSISGQVLEQTITSAVLSNGARYEVVVELSYHPATQGRPAGQYRLIYRFGGWTTGRALENGGLTGVVILPKPASGSVQRLSPETDVAAFWPSMLAYDNAMYGVSFVAKSPRLGAVANVKVASVRFVRNRSTAAAVRADQAALVSTYQPRFGALTPRPTTETSKTLPDMNPFSIPQYFPDYTTLSTNSVTRHHQISAQVHGQGGIISYNHPFGYNGGPLLPLADRIAKRRQLFASMRAVNQYEADILEVGYSLRGNVDTFTHLDLWDTFSRSGIWLTGNGVSDDHAGQHWSTLANGFLTGAWATGRTDAELKAALSSGRAYTYHPGRWAGAELDLLVDGTVPMGSVSVATQASRQLAIWAAGLPAGSSVRVVSGPVDYSGAVDPGTTTVRTLAPSAFTGNVATISVDTTTSRFYRVTVVTSTGAVAAASNPVWLLRTSPPGGIPPARG
ncbi:MAG: hypothetical protein ACTHN8_09245 [Angustibacter sp.]